METNKIKITGNRYNPMWEKLEVGVIPYLADYRLKLSRKKYELIGGNQVAKDNKLYWIIWDDDYNFSLEEYGYYVE